MQRTKRGRFRFYNLGIRMRIKLNCVIYMFDINYILCISGCCYFSLSFLSFGLFSHEFESVARSRARIFYSMNYEEKKQRGLFFWTTITYAKFSNLISKCFFTLRFSFDFIDLFKIFNGMPFTTISPQWLSTFTFLLSIYVVLIWVSFIFLFSFSAFMIFLLLIFPLQSLSLSYWHLSLVLNFFVFLVLHVENAGCAYGLL